MVEMESAPSQVEVELFGKIMEVVSAFNFLRRCFSEEEGQQEDVKMRVVEALKCFSAMKVMLKVRGVSWL